MHARACVYIKYISKMSEVLHSISVIDSIVHTWYFVYYEEYCLGNKRKEKQWKNRINREIKKKYCKMQPKKKKLT